MADFKRTKLHLVFKAEEDFRRAHSKSIKLQGKGHWRDAADEMVACGKLLKGRLMGMPLQSACFYASAADNYFKVDKTEALKTYQIAIQMYCDLARFDVAGTLERTVASIHYQNKHWEEAGVHYRKAADFLSGERQIEASDLCYNMSADCLIRIGESMQACKVHQQIAKSCATSNLRKFNARSHLMKAIVFMMGMKVEITIKDIETIMKNEATHLIEQRRRRIIEKREERQRNKSSAKEAAAAEERGEERVSTEHTHE